MSKVIEVENVSKIYDLGLVGTGTLSKDLNRSWAKLRGKPDPYATLVETNDRTEKSSSNTVYALKDINFSVEQGEVLGIIGKNGAGKSTLLKILSQITSPSTGSIKMKGRVASLLEVGTGMHPEMTARQNIYLNGSLMGMRRQEITSKLDEIVAFAGIEKYIDTPVKRFSSGMSVRLGFAVAAFLEPEILIVDEVLAVGDYEFQKKAIGKMQDVSKGEGRTVLFVSHNMTSIQNLCTSTTILNNGELIFQGGVREGIDYYLQSNIRKNTDKLKNRKDRIGGKIFRFTNFELVNSSNTPIEFTTSGSDIQFKIDFEIEEPLKNLYIKIEILDTQGKTITVLNNLHCASPFKKVTKNGSFYCKIINLPISSGNYLVNLTAWSQDQVIDSIEYAGEFSIDGGDYFGTGKIPKARNIVYMPQEYSVDYLI